MDVLSWTLTSSVCSKVRNMKTIESGILGIWRSSVSQLNCTAVRS